MARSRHRRLTAGLAAALVVAVAALAVVLSGGDSGMAGRALAAEFIDTSGVTVPTTQVGGEVDDSAAGDGRAVGHAGGQALAGAIVSDLTEFWSQALPPITGRAFTPLRGGVIAVDSNAATGSAPCVAAPADIVGNAYYCPSDDGIVYDATTLIPVILHRSGIGGIITTFAHEFGHAVQARITSDGATGATGSGFAAPLVTEARADCDAGAFLAWAVAGNAPHLQVSADIVITAIGPLVDFSDPATVGPDDPTAHGLAVDRLGWFITGYRDGAGACVDLGDPLRTALGRVDGTPQATPRYASRSALLAAAERSIGAVGGVPVRADVPQSLLDAAAPHGQFAQATLVALAAAAARGADPTAAACFAGSWVHAVFGHAATGELGDWPGDPDEGLAAVLLRPDVTFTDVQAYIAGFRSGADAC